MKKVIGILTMCLISFLYAFQAEAGPFISGSTGADGPFNPPTTVPAGTVVNGNAVIIPLPPSGIFNFTTVDISTAMTVKFQRNAANTPVYILTTGDVNVAGTIDISGGDGTPGNNGNIGPVPGGKGGPGGFDGGNGGVAPSGGFQATVPGYGLGPGGGNTCDNAEGMGNGGVFATQSPYYSSCVSTATPYGNYTLIPLIGGSGGAGGYYPFYGGVLSYGGGGGGGGGAILIASSGNIDITGTINAQGGKGSVSSSGVGNFGGGGSGGAIRLIGNRVTASNAAGTAYALLASGGTAFFNMWENNCGSIGRIRIEAYSSSGITTDQTAYNPPSITTPTIVFLPQIPSLSIVNIAGISVPSSATGSYGNPDISLPSATTNPVSVQVVAANIPTGTTITVQAVPQNDIPSSSTATLSGSTSSSTATASVNISLTNPTIITAQTIFAVQTAMYWEGEKIDKVRVASAMGKQSQAVYITESGKEIPAAKLFASLTK